jgi:hypothetical protein
MELSKRKGCGAEGRLDVLKDGSPWEVKVRNSWVSPFLATPPHIKRNIQTYRDKKDVHRWGLGLLMLVRYADSPIGPYDELLYGIPFQKPRWFEVMSHRRLPVTYVSSEASLHNGRHNRGIRKELADFEFHEQRGF